MPIDAARTARGALAGGVAATVWALQQPLDMRVFGVPYDDPDLLGSAVTGGAAARPLGWILHAANGALFGAAYSVLGPRLPLPAWARGPAAGLIEHAATWPATAAVPRLHPRPERFPALWGSRAALAQATWRHLLFGTVMGEVERRLNPPLGDGAGPPDMPAYSSNGHGDLGRAAIRVTPLD